jgi:methylmalonic aciduria homocystinuria type C protein
MNAFDTIQERLAASGLDLCAPVDVAAYNEDISDVPQLLALREGPAFVVGNTRAMWPHILAGAPLTDNPVDDWVIETIRQALADVPSDVYFAHHGGKWLVSMVRMARLAGLGEVAPTHLLVHPTFGPWISLRALVLIDAEVPPPAPEVSVCAGCPAPCVPAFAKAVELAPHGPVVNGIAVSNWHAWVDARDACPVGREHRFSDEQVAYHYTRDPRSLKGHTK